MIDVEAGKEDLFERLNKKLKEVKSTRIYKDIKILYFARCYTHSDISLLVDAKNPNLLPKFITELLLKMDGAWDIQIIPLLDPTFFNIPKYIKDGNYQHFTITLDVKSGKTESVFSYLKEFAATDEAAISFLAYSFYSYDNDIILSLLARDIAQAGKFLSEKIRTIDGVIDSFLWQIEKWQFVISDKDWLEYINYFRMADFDNQELWEGSHKVLIESYLCAC
jgi:DNA-binding Lrp family transcriptional regulator